MKLKGDHVEEDGKHDEADGAGDKVAEEGRHADLQVAQELPQLKDGGDPDGRNGEEADPFDAQYGTQGETCQGEPDPPLLSEGAVGVFDREALEEERCEGDKEDKGRVEENESGLCDEAVLKGDEKRDQEGCGGVQGHDAESEVADGHQSDAKETTDQTHGDVWDVEWCIFSDQDTSGKVSQRILFVSS